MPRYYFDIEVLGLIERSTAGEDFPDLPTAIAAANDCAMQMVAEDIACGDGAGHGSVLVRDRRGQIVHRITFLEAEEMARSSSGKPH